MRLRSMASSYFSPTPSRRHSGVATPFGSHRFRENHRYAAKFGEFGAELLILKTSDQSPAALLRCFELILGLGLKIAGIMAFMELRFQIAEGSIDHAATLDGGSVVDLFGPPHDMLI